MELQASGCTDQAAVNAAADRVAVVATELDATGRGRQELQSSIAQLEGHAGQDVDLHRQELAARLVAAEALVDERRRQQRHMPAPLPGDGDAEQVRLRRAIGKARGDLARTQVQMMLSRDDPAAVQRWAGRHREAALAALDLHTQLRTAQAGGAPAPGFLSASEQRLWRRGGADQAAMVALSHRRAVIRDHPDAFDTVVPVGTREARETGEVYQGAKPEPVEDLYGDPADSEEESTATPDASEPEDNSTREPDDDRDVDTTDNQVYDDDEPVATSPGRKGTRTAPSGRHTTDRATADRKRRRKAERRQQKQAQQRAGQRRKREIREVSVMVHRVKRLSSKADQGQGTGIECGGVLMLDYFQTNLG